MSEFIGDDGITKLTWSQYKQKGDHLRKTQGYTAKQIKDLYGKPVIDGVVVEITTGGPNTIRQRSAAAREKSRLNRQRKTGAFKNVDTLPTDIKKWGKRLTDKGLWPEGKSLEGFIQAHKTSQTKLLSDIKALKEMGFIDDETGKSLIDDGHLIAVGKEQKTGHPLRSKGTYGSHFGEARVPELSAVNQAKREAGDIDFLDARRGGIIDSDLEAFSQYLTDDVGFGPGVKPSTSSKQRIAQGANPDQVIESQIEKTETTRQRQAFNANLSKLDPKIADAVKVIDKLSGKTRKVDLAAQTATGIATGNPIQAGVAGTTLAASEVLGNPKVQKRIAKQIAEITAKRGAKSAAKFIPGLDILISGKETYDYLKQGKLDQAGIAAVSGAIGWIPIIGDGASAALDLSNTAIDIARLDIPNQKKSKTKVDTDLPTNRGALKSAIKSLS